MKTTILKLQLLLILFCLTTPLAIKLLRTMKIYPNFTKSESAPSTNFCMVSHSWTANNWTKGSGDRTRCNSLCFLNSVLSPAVFPSRLIEPSFYKSLPILMEMAIRNHIISLPHDCDNPTSPKIINTV